MLTIEPSINAMALSPSQNNLVVQAVDIQTSYVFISPTQVDVVYTEVP